MTLDQFVTRIEDNPVLAHGGKKGALTEAEKLLLVQQDELRRLRDAAQAGAPSRSITPTAPEPEAKLPSPPAAKAPVAAPALPSTTSSVELPQAPAAAPAQGGDPLGAFNVVGILAAGILGGLLYQNKQGAKRTEDQLKSAVVTKQQVLPSHTPPRPCSISPASVYICCSTGALWQRIRV